MNRTRYISIILLIISLLATEKAQALSSDTKDLPRVLIQELATDSVQSLAAKWKVKVTAIGLAIALGPFGVHRLYLGTSAYVPVAYTLTLGGGIGFLPVMDIITILVTKDLEKLKNHPGMFLFLPK